MTASPQPLMPEDAQSRLSEVQHRVKKLGDNLQAWHVELSNMRSLSVKYGLGLHQDHVNTFDLSDGSVGQVGMPTVSVIDPPPRLSVGDEAAGPWIVYPDEPDQLFPLRSVGYLIPAPSLPVLVINLDAADRHILAEVERVLRERKSNRALHRTTGAYSLSRSLKEPAVIARWRRYHIVEIMELLAWRACQEDCKQQYTDLLIGSWIDEDYLNSQNMSIAFNIIREAISSISAILSETHPMLSQSKPTLDPE